MANELDSTPLASTAPLQGQPTTADLLFNAIYGQESNFGANTATSSTGARGPMQVEPATFNMFARPGENIDNPEDNIRVAKRIIQYYMTKYNDPARVAVAYYSGEGNVAPPDSTTPWIHNFTPKNGPSVAQYVGSIGQRMNDPNIAALATRGSNSQQAEETLTPKSLLDVSLDFGQDLAKQRAAQQQQSVPTAQQAARGLPPASPPHFPTPAQPVQPLRAPGPLEIYNALLKRPQPLESNNG